MVPEHFTGKQATPPTTFCFLVRTSIKTQMTILFMTGPLKSALSEYISKLDGVKLIRSNRRLGVIRGRMLGAARATGDVLVFMDSHCECQKGWLEPLLARLSSNR